MCQMKEQHHNYNPKYIFNIKIPIIINNIQQQQHDDEQIISYVVLLTFFPKMADIIHAHGLNGNKIILGSKFSFCLFILYIL
jgi:hypothetical protein